MRRFRWLAIALALTLAGTAPLLAQTQDTAKKQEKEKEKKPEKKAPKKSDQAPPAGDTADLATERKNLTRVLRAVSDAIEGNSPRRLREYTDERFYDYPRFEEQVTDFLQNNSEMRVNFRESTAEVKGDKATLIVDADMTYALKDNPRAEQKRHERIQFDFVRTATGWKIYEITPRRFFVP